MASKSTKNIIRSVVENVMISNIWRMIVVIMKVRFRDKGSVDRWF